MKKKTLWLGILAVACVPLMAAVGCCGDNHRCGYDPVTTLEKRVAADERQADRDVVDTNYKLGVQKDISDATYQRRGEDRCYGNYGNGGGNGYGGGYGGGINVNANSNANSNGTSGPNRRPQHESFSWEYKRE